jgi:hypothetical protein
MKRVTRIDVEYLLRARGVTDEYAYKYISYLIGDAGVRRPYTRWTAAEMASRCENAADQARRRRRETS